MATTPNSVSLGKIAKEFLRMGSVGYGGPIALVALMEKECSGRLGWISPAEFAEAYVYCKLLPGPVAYQMAIWIGQHVRGRRGGFIAGASFLVPSFFLILLLSIYYADVKNLPGAATVFEGLRAGALVVMADSSWRLLKPYRESTQAWAFVVVALGLMLLLPRWEPLIIISGGVAVVLFQRLSSRPKLSLNPAILATLFWTHFKAGIFVFGTGLAIVPVLEREAVHHFHWLTSQEFLDGVAFGQITPGPVTITSVFIGYKVAQVPGALAGLFGMYSPGLILVLGVVPWLRRKIEGRQWLHHFQKGAVPMVIGCIIGATFLLGKASVNSWLGISVFLILGGLALTARVPGWLLIPLGSVLSFLLSRFAGLSSLPLW